MDPRASSISILANKAMATELPSVLSCLRSLCEDKELVDAIIVDTAREFNEQQHLTIAYGTEKVIYLQISNNAKISNPISYIESNENIEEEYKNECQTEGNWYFSPSNKKIFNVDVINQEIIEVRDANESLLFMSEKLSALREEAEKYRKDHYPTGSIEVFPINESDQEFVIRIGSMMQDEKNMRSGSWCSEFNITIDGTKNVGIDGSVRAASHLYESGNVLAQLNKRVRQSLELDTIFDDDIKKNSSIIFLTINQAESQYYDHVVANYENLKRRFRTVRRQLPVSGTKVDWESKSMGKHLMY